MCMIPKCPFSLGRMFAHDIVEVSTEAGPLWYVRLPPHVMQVYN